MDINTFTEMLSGKDPVEAYIESDICKKEISTYSSLAAVIQILVDKNIVTVNELEEYQEKFEEIYKDRVRAELKKLQEE